MIVHVYVYENTETTLWFESLVVCEGGPWRLLREYDKEIPDPVGPGGTTDYNQLQNRPQINDVTLSGNKTSQDLKIADKSALIALQNQAEDIRLAGEATQAELTEFKNDIAIDLGGIVERLGTHFEVGAEKWYGTYTAEGVTYQVYSKLLDIGALPSAAGATQYPHGITGINQILQISGFTNDGFVMNAPRQNVQDNISVYQAQKSGNIVVEVGKDRSSKTGFVMLIYAKNN